LATGQVFGDIFITGREERHPTNQKEGGNKMSTKNGLKLRLLVSIGIAAICIFSMFNGEATATEASCTNLITGFSYPNTTITSATWKLDGAVTVTGIGPMPEHCVVVGKMNPRTSAVDGKTYWIGFEMRLPTDWKGRFFYQANGGTDGSVAFAYGGILGGGPTSNGLKKGFAVISSDAGHQALDPYFGIDPQARIDYGYNAVAQLTPMAKSLISNYYGRFPDKSYFAGSSNGGRHAMVAASRYSDQYDGILAGAPGFNLPQAAVAQLWGVQQYAPISTFGANGRPDINTSFTPKELAVVGDAILAKCDALDGLLDAMVSDPVACQAKFNISSDVPTCPGARDDTCLTNDQKTVLAAVYAGAKNSAGRSLYKKFLWDVGIKGSGWRSWKFGNSINVARDPGAVAFIFTTPPQSVVGFNGLDYALNWGGTGFNPDIDATKIYATSGIYTESAMSFMTPPDLTMPGLFANNTKLMVMHGVSDPVFSAADTINWYERFRTRWRDRAMGAARLFLVPQMNHSSGGPACDQFDMIDALVKWVEEGTAPESIIATARGTGANVVNTEVPATWAANRTRLLCPYPATERFVGKPGVDSIEDAKNFLCVMPTEVRIKPETINLRSRGDFTAFIDYPAGYDARNWQITNVFCEGADAERGKGHPKRHIARKGRCHNEQYIAEFDVQDLEGVAPGKAVEFTVTATATYQGQTVLFEGTDKVRVIK
jgi:hypothetical protein